MQCQGKLENLTMNNLEELRKKKREILKMKTCAKMNFCCVKINNLKDV